MLPKTSTLIIVSKVQVQVFTGEPHFPKRRHEVVKPLASGLTTESHHTYYNLFPWLSLNDCCVPDPVLSTDESQNVSATSSQATVRPGGEADASRSERGFRGVALWETRRCRRPFLRAKDGGTRSLTVPRNVICFFK